jgi:uncharacterized protein (DUF1499 family)
MMAGRIKERGEERRHQESNLKLDSNKECSCPNAPTVVYAAIESHIYKIETCNLF